MVKIAMNPLGDTQSSTSSIDAQSKLWRSKKRGLLIVHDTTIAAMDLERLCELEGRQLLFRRCLFGPSCQRALDAIRMLAFRCDDCRGIDLGRLADLAR